MIVINNVSMIGRLVRDPELKTLPSGIEVCNFTVALDKELSKDKKDEFREAGKPTADFIPVTMFGKRAATYAQYHSKGDMTSIVGRMQSRTYQDQAGNNRTIVEVNADKFDFINGGSKSGNAKPAQKPQPDTFDNMFMPTDDDDIPF